MNEAFEIGLYTVVVGAGATIVMDTWMALQKALGMQTMDLGMVGRWLAHLAHGQVRHVNIANSAPVPGEVTLGWIAHYVIGLVFAASLIAWQGLQWTRVPTLPPAMAVGLVTVAAPLLIMQPAMGAGVASSKTRTPLRNCARSVANHAVFGLGLYLAALITARIVP